ncbi:MAG: hypothetical protein WA581_12030 [Candidatus Acidiferrales bacterium]
MSGAGVKQSPVAPDADALEGVVLDEQTLDALRERQAATVRLLWNCRAMFFRAGAIGLLVSTLVAFLIPKEYTSTAQLMPPDTQSASGLAMMTALAGRAGDGLGSVAGDLLGLKSSGELFIGVLRSETAEDRIIDEFDLKKVYGKRLLVEARKKLDENTTISEDRRSGIISISVTDHSPKRAAEMANAYVDELNALMADLSTSSAHRERVFLEERLKVAKQELDDATNALAQFSSKNNTIDIQTEGKAMLDAAASLAGELIASESQLEGLRQIYTDANPRVRSLSARVTELREQLDKLGGTHDSVAGADQSSTIAGSIPFPTIRNLPLLGAKYAGYYRDAKIQETVFELLTEQYELAKVQEAKETPSVKVLDPGRTPERKSYPPRLMIAVLGTFLALVVTSAWVLATRYWSELNPRDPRKVLAEEIVSTVKANTPWASRNGDAPHSTRKTWSWINRVGRSEKSPTEE